MADVGDMVNNKELCDAGALGLSVSCVAMLSAAQARNPLGRHRAPHEAAGSLKRPQDAPRVRLGQPHAPGVRPTHAHWPPPHHPLCMSKWTFDCPGGLLLFNVEQLPAIFNFEICRRG